MQRLAVALLLVIPFVPVTSHAQTTDPRQIIRESAEAIGGLDRLRALRSIRVEEQGGEYLVSTLTRADAPPKWIAQSMVTLRSMADTAMRKTTSQVLPMRPGRFSNTTVANRGAVANVRATSLVPGATFDG